jgi:hypothetical protein
MAAVAAAEFIAPLQVQRPDVQLVVEVELVLLQQLLVLPIPVAVAAVAAKHQDCLLLVDQELS